MDDDQIPPHGACPHIDRDDHRCSSRLCLGRLNQAFNVCFGAYKACPMFHRINCEIAVEDDVAAPVVTITAHGSQLPLRATGT